MNVQEIVDLKRKLTATWNWPWKHTAVCELAFLCGENEKEKLLELIALFYGVNLSFVTDLLNSLEAMDPRELLQVSVEGMPQVSEVISLHNHFSGKTPIMFSLEWEERIKITPSREEALNKGFVHALHGLPLTVNWQFDYHLSFVDGLVDQITTLIKNASAEDLSRSLERKSNIDPLILSSIAHEIFDRRVPLISGHESCLERAMEFVPVRYAWEMIKQGRMEGVPRLYLSNGNTPFQMVMFRTPGLVGIEAEIWAEKDPTRLASLLRRANDVYVLKRIVHSRMIKLCS